MIRLFLTSVMMLAFAAGCLYFWWQSVQLRGQVATLQAQVVQLKKREARHGGRHHGAVLTGAGAESEDDAAAEGWLALANRHADNAKAAFDRHDFGTAQAEFTKAIDDVRRGTEEPVQAAQSTVVQVRQKIAQLQGGIMRGVTGASGH